MADKGPSFLALPDRVAKPRSSGLTHVLDKGLSLLGLESLLQAAGASIDIVKLGWGTAYASGGVDAKVALCRDAGIHVSPGGTLLEICERQGRVRDYARWLQRLGITHVEVSNGALGMSLDRKRELITFLSQDFVVLSECGSKDPTAEVVGHQWAQEMSGDLAAGATLVIAEARESGTVGLYDALGQVRSALVERLIVDVPAEKIIFEAPLKDQQVWFVRRLGVVANIGNVPADEVVPLETLRLGLRSDTLDLLPPTTSGPVDEHACAPPAGDGMLHR